MESITALTIITAALAACTILAAATPRRISRKIKHTAYTWAECLFYAIFLVIYKLALLSYDIQTVVKALIP